MLRVLGALALLVLAACEPLRHEAGTPGGYVEHLADRNILVANAQNQRTGRYVVTLTMLASLAADFSETGGEARAVASEINTAYRLMAKLSEAEGKCIGAAADCLTTPGNSGFAYENHAYEMQRVLYRLSKSTLASADLDDLADDIAEGNVVALVSAAKRAFPIARRVLATYRDAVVVFADAVHAKCGTGLTKKASIDGCEAIGDALTLLKVGKGVGYDAEVRQVTRLARDIQKVARQQEVEWRFEKKHRNALVYHIDQACNRLLGAQLALVENGDFSEVVNCGQASDLVPGNDASKARATYLN